MEIWILLGIPRASLRAMKFSNFEMQSVFQNTMRRHTHETLPPRKKPNRVEDTPVSSAADFRRCVKSFFFSQRRHFKNGGESVISALRTKTPTQDHNERMEDLYSRQDVERKMHHKI